VSGGGTLVAVQYNLTGADPAKVESVTFVMSGNTTGDEGYVGFGGTGNLGTACDPLFDDPGGTPANPYPADTTYNNCPLPGGNDIVVGSATLASLDLAVIPAAPGGGPLG
jgi:hypothetical protein